MNKHIELHSSDYEGVKIYWTVPIEFIDSNDIKRHIDFREWNDFSADKNNEHTFLFKFIEHLQNNLIVTKFINKLTLNVYNENKEILQGKFDMDTYKIN